MSEWKKVKIGDVCKIAKGTTGIASAEPGKYPLVVTAVERKTCSTYQFDCDAVCIPLVSSSGHGKKSLNNVHYQSGKFALGTILCAVIPNNSDELDARYLHQYLQFYKDTVLVPLMKGAANVSLSMKDIAGVLIPLPPIKRQRELAEMFVSLQEKQKELFTEFEKQKSYAKQLRQNILQEAIEGKLTTDWRKQHPIQKGNPDYDTQALFAKIQAEKSETKNSKKTVAPITKDEIPFEIPTNWKWVRLGEICNSIDAGKSILCKETVPNDNEIGIVKTGVCSFGYFKEEESKTCLSKNDWHNEYAIHKGDFLISRANTLELVGSCVVVDSIHKKLMLSDKILRMTFYNRIDKKMILYVMRTAFLRNQIELSSTGSSPTMKNISQDSMRKYLLPLPPLAEQKEIVARVEQHLQTITQLETQIATRETTTKQLMQSILKDAFEEG